MYFVLRPKTIVTQKINKDIEEQNQKLAGDLKAQQYQAKQLTETRQHLAEEVARLSTAKEELKKHIEEIDTNTNKIYEKSYNLMQEKLSQAAEEEREKFEEAKNQAKKEYATLLAEVAQAAAVSMDDINQSIEVLRESLKTYQKTSDAVIEAAKREEEKKLEINKYKLLISEEDSAEIFQLENIVKYFRNPRPIYKIIWESYYRKATNDLINRIIGNKPITGIYKITNTGNQQSYIGQSVNIGERLKEHIKCGLGIDMPNNILYVAMFNCGVRAFTFEVLEECERSQLNEREKYYIDFYHTQEFGYNMTKGGARN